jgi:hypothetical protein
MRRPFVAVRRQGFAITIKQASKLGSSVPLWQACMALVPQIQVDKIRFHYRSVRATHGVAPTISVNLHEPAREQVVSWL